MTIQDEFVERLKAHAEFLPVCPEVEIGLGVPRDPIRVILKNNERRLVQPATESDVTAKMCEFCSTFLNKIHEIDGFILKSRSPHVVSKRSRYTQVSKRVPRSEREADSSATRYWYNFRTYRSKMKADCAIS